MDAHLALLIHPPLRLSCVCVTASQTPSVIYIRYTPFIRLPHYSTSEPAITAQHTFFLTRLRTESASAGVHSPNCTGARTRFIKGRDADELSPTLTLDLRFTRSDIIAFRSGGADHGSARSHTKPSTPWVRPCFPLTANLDARILTQLSPQANH